MRPCNPVESPTAVRRADDTLARAIVTALVEVSSKGMNLRAKQRGQVFFLMLTIMIMGFAWYVSRALYEASMATAAREARTGLALSTAKQAVLAYVARMAADNNEASPGRLPCPEIRALATNTDYQGRSGPQLQVP